MEIVAHRVNSSHDLQQLPASLWIEADFRSWLGEVVLAHDALDKGENVVDWLSKFCHRGLIVNVKETGLEEKISHILRSAGIENFFFLDQAPPSQIDFLLSGNRLSALRFSEWENSPELSAFAEWSWIDSFAGNPRTTVELARLAKELGLKTCIVAPDLRFTPTEGEKAVFRQVVLENLPVVDLVCTKEPSFWI